MIIISDTTPLITLIKINEIDILKNLFGEIIIPREVYDELVSGESFNDEKEYIDNAKYIKVIDVDKNKVDLVIDETGLDRGESAAITLYEEQKDKALLIIDEKKGREVAKSRNIKITGTIGILAIAYRRKLKSKSEILSIIELIKKRRNYYSNDLFDELIKSLK